MLVVPLDRWHLKVKLSFALICNEEARVIKQVAHTKKEEMVKKWGYLRIGRIYIMNGYSSFNATKCKSCRLVLFVFEDGNATMLKMISV